MKFTLQLLDKCVLVYRGRERQTDRQTDRQTEDIYICVCVFYTSILVCSCIPLSVSTYRSLFFLLLCCALPYDNIVSRTIGTPSIKPMERCLKHKHAFFCLNSHHTPANMPSVSAYCKRLRVTTPRTIILMLLLLLYCSPHP